MLFFFYFFNWNVLGDRELCAMNKYILKGCNLFSILFHNFI